MVEIGWGVCKRLDRLSCEVGRWKDEIGESSEKQGKKHSVVEFVPRSTSRQEIAGIAGIAGIASLAIFPGFIFISKKLAYLLRL